jgi:hypothetical protein
MADGSGALSLWDTSKVNTEEVQLPQIKCHGKLGVFPMGSHPWAQVCIFIFLEIELRRLLTEQQLSREPFPFLPKFVIILLQL